MWMDAKNFEDNVVIDKCDKCEHGVIKGTYTDCNNWCNLYEASCRNSKDGCEK